MSENENIAAENVNDEIKTIDLKKVISQHLQALARSGVETLPQGSGTRLYISADIARPPSIAQQKTEAETLTKQPQQVAESSVGPLPIPAATLAAEPSDLATPEPTLAIKGPTVKATTTKRPPTALDSVELAGVSGDSTPYGPSLALAQRENALTIIRDEVAACTQCAELVASRTQTVFGVGNMTPRLVFVGEAPGADEDRLGEPFVGAAGQLLDKIMTASKLKRADVFILNTVKCRPPANRNPSQTELDHCWDYAHRQLEVLQPEFICCLGSVAAKRLLNSTQSLGKLRQKFHQYRNSRVIVTYHPAYLLRTESAKKHVWEDMKLLMKEMGVDLTK